MNYNEWLNGSGCCQPKGCGCKDIDVCDCENILLELSRQHTDDLVLQDQIDYVSGTVETNYYTKQEVDEKIGSGGSGTSVTVDDHMDANSTNPVQNKVITEALNGKLDASAYTPTDLSDYYTKQEVNSAITSVENEIPSLSGYATEQWVEDKHYITSGDSVFNNYATTASTANFVTSGNVETQIENHFWCGDSSQWAQISGNTQPNVLYLIY